MKKIFCFTLSIVLTAALLTGCGCTNQNMEETSKPTMMPTTETTLATTAPTTMPATQPTTATQDGNGAATTGEDGITGGTDVTGTGAAEETTATNGARMIK